MVRSIAGAWCVAVLVSIGSAAAQKLNTFNRPEPGDKLVYSWTLNNNKAQQMEEEFTAVEGAELRGVQRTGGKEFALVLPAVGQVSQGICLSNGQPCSFTPPLQILELPVEKGRKWNGQYTVKGETFTAEVAAERKLDKVEKIKVAAGEFEAFRVSSSGRIKGTDTKGNAFSGKEEGREWYALINGKMVPVRLEYRNSFGEKYTRDLLSATLK
jgi:hypothetical protein